jgi:hypothetical protein
MHREVSQREMIDALRELAKVNIFSNNNSIQTNDCCVSSCLQNRTDAIRDKVLELIQCWSHGLGKLVE